MAGYSNEAMFHANRDAMNLVIEAGALFDSGKVEAGADKMGKAMRKFIDNQKEFTPHVNAIAAKRRNEALIKHTKELWHGFFEAKSEVEANMLLNQIDSALKKFDDSEVFKSSNLQNLFDLQKVIVSILQKGQ